MVQTVGFLNQQGAYDTQVFGSGTVFGSHVYVTGDVYTVTVRVMGPFSPTGETKFAVIIS